MIVVLAVIGGAVAGRGFDLTRGLRQSGDREIHPR